MIFHLDVWRSISNSTSRKGLPDIVMKLWLCESNMGTTHFLFNATQSLNVAIRLNSWLTMALQDLIQVSTRLKMVFRKLIQMNSRLKTSSIILIQIHGKKLSESWFETTQDSMLLFIPSFVWPFLGFQLSCWLGITYFGLSTQMFTSYDLFGVFYWSVFPTNWFESAHDSSSILETWVDSTQDSSSFPGIGSESTHDSSGFPSIDLDRHMTQTASPIFFDLNQHIT